MPKDLIPMSSRTPWGLFCGYPEPC